jgi:hypothetical protein
MPAGLVTGGPREDERIRVDESAFGRKRHIGPRRNPVAQPIGSREPLAVDGLATKPVAALRKPLLELGERDLVESGLGALEEEAGQPPVPKAALVLCAMITRPLGARIVMDFHGSPSSSICSPASPSVPLISMKRSESASGTGLPLALLVFAAVACVLSLGPVPARAPPRSRRPRLPVLRLRLR